MLSVPKAKSRSKPPTLGPNRLGSGEEKFIEQSLQKSFDRSDGTAGNAIDIVNIDEPETGGSAKTPTPTLKGGLTKSALKSFGISRQQLEAMGIGEKALQDRIYRTLTIWSSSMYDSLNNLSNGNQELSAKLWAVYLRLIDVCNPAQSDILSIKQRQQFEENMRKAASNVEKTKMEAEDNHRKLVDRLQHMEKVAAETTMYAQTAVPQLQAEVATLQRDLDNERALGKKRLAEMLMAQQSSREVLSALESTENQLISCQKELHHTADQLHVSQAEVERITKAYNITHEEKEKIEASTKEAASKEERMRNKLAAVAESRQATDGELEKARKAIVDSRQEGEKLKQALRDSDAIRSSSLHILKDLVIKYRDVTRLLCDSDKAQLDFVQDNVEHGAFSVEDMDLLKLKDNRHSLLELSHYIASALPRGIVSEKDGGSQQQKPQDDLSTVQQEKDLCGNVHAWVEHINSLASGLDREGIQRIVANVERVFDRKMAVFDDLYQERQSGIRQSAAVKLISESWMDQYCDETAKTAKLSADYREITEDFAQLTEKKRLVDAQVAAMKQEIIDLKVVAAQRDDAVRELKRAQEEKKTALDKYAMTHVLEQQVEALEQEASIAKDRVREQLDITHDQATLLGRLSMDIKHKQKALEDSNAVSISLLSVIGALLEESEAQKHACTGGVAALHTGDAVTEEHVHAVAGLHMTSLHTKLMHIDASLDGVLAGEEKEVILRLMSNVIGTRATLHTLLEEASKTTEYKSRAILYEKEKDSLKSWINKERARLNKHTEYIKQQCKDDTHHLREEITHLNGQVTKCKERNQSDHREKMVLLQDILDLEKRLQQQQQQQQQVKDNSNAVPASIGDGDGDDFASRSHSQVDVVAGGGGGGGGGLLADGTPAGQDDDVDGGDQVLKVRIPSAPAPSALAGAGAGAGAGPNRRGTYYVHPQDVKLDDDILGGDGDDGGGGDGVLLYGDISWSGTEVLSPEE
jgi:hypothetical protein